MSSPTPPQTELLTLADCTVLAAPGFRLEPGDTAKLTFRRNVLTILARHDIQERIYTPEICDIVISGPGTVTTGGGFMGGGFGIEGALGGMALASVMNALTTTTKVHTYLALVCTRGELHLHLSTIEPGALRIAMAPIFVLMRHFDPQFRARAEARIDQAARMLGDNHSRLRDALEAGPSFETR